MEILCIGNSFSRDAATYLHGIARHGGEKINIVNLYIGGCSLETHYNNMLTGAKAYELQVNGALTGFSVSLQEALTNRMWDYVSLQQASHFSIKYETYQPYLYALDEYVKRLAPNARRIIHETWAYENGSERLCSELGYKTHADMFRDIKSSYEKAAESINADLIIHSGTLFAKLVDEGFKIHEDTFHASLGTGRYALGLLWYKTLTGNDVMSNTFSDFLREIPGDEVLKIKKIVSEI